MEFDVLALNWLLRPAALVNRVDTQKLVWGIGRTCWLGDWPLQHHCESVRGRLPFSPHSYELVHRKRAVDVLLHMIKLTIWHLAAHARRGTMG